MAIIIQITFYFFFWIRVTAGNFNSKFFIYNLMIRMILSFSWY